MGSASHLKEFTGVILAGGRSSRMGQDKGLMEVEGVALLKRVSNVLFELFTEVLVVQDRAGHYEPLYLHEARKPRFAVDAVSHQGPIGGVRAAFEHLQTPHFFLTGCDAPFLQQAAVERVCCALNSKASAAAAMIDGVVQPLFAAYRASAVREILAKQEPKSPRGVLSLLNEGIVEVSEDALREVDPALRSFVNLNTPPSMAH